MNLSHVVPLAILLSFVFLLSANGAHAKRETPFPAVSPRNIARQVNGGGSCSQPRVRRAWNNFSDSEKRAYINAALCLIWQRNAQTGLPGVQSRWDDFAAVHQTMTNQIHSTGLFLPWHRLFVFIQESLLRSQCGYSGDIPYWNEPSDAGSFSRSIVFSPTTGFGSGITNATRCVPDGPFANYTAHIGPGEPQANMDHCLMRAVEDIRSFAVGDENVRLCHSFGTFVDMWRCTEGMPHATGHNAVGGDMLNMRSSPNDPLFYLHHAWIDKLWYDWQRAGTGGDRYREIGGGIQPGGQGEEVKLNDTLGSLGLWEVVTIERVMNTAGDYLCYVYQ